MCSKWLHALREDELAYMVVLMISIWSIVRKISSSNDDSCNVLAEVEDEGQSA